MLVIRTVKTDPCRNLAVEEMLLDRIRHHPLVLFLWQSDCAVVVGKNQNPWRECDLRLLEAAGGKLARRLSGGGAVYHDLGNLNFSFVMQRDGCRRERPWQALMAALKGAGVSAAYDGRHSLFVEGGKVSGSAFCLRRKAVLHHGTLLIASDLDRLRRCLAGAPASIRTHAVASVSSPVTNLVSLNPALTVEEAAGRLVQSAAQVFGESVDTVGDDCLEELALDELVARYDSWEWRFGRTPAFVIDLEHRFAWGRLSLRLDVCEGCVNDAALSANGLEASLRKRLAAAWLSSPFRSGDLEQRAAQAASGPQDERLRDVAAWIGRAGF